MDTSKWTDLLVGAFPNLASEGFSIVGAPSEVYNCIAYAAGDTSKWWWPDGVNYWPPWAAETDRKESLKEVFAGLGYERCDDGRADGGYQKVALYEVNGEMKHAAMQMPSGRWRSKMGQGPVIEHRSPDSLSNGIYGDATTYMGRMALLESEE